MAIAFLSSTVSTNTAVATAVPVAYPANIAAADGLVLIVGVKPYTATIVTPTNWTALGGVTNGTTAQGLDTGSMKAAAFFLSPTGALSGSLTVSITSGNSSWASMFRYTKSPAGTWQTGFASGTDTTANTTWLVAYSSNPGIQSGDHMVLGGVTSTDALCTWSAFSLAATGATVAAPTQWHNPRVTTGNNAGGNVSISSCTAGIASANPTWTATLSSGINQSGAAVLVRLREVLPAANVPGPYIVAGEAVRRAHSW
jgi:hypothetical protein